MGEIDNVVPGQPGQPDRLVLRSDRHVADLTRLRCHRRQLRDLAAARRALVLAQLPLSEELQVRLRRLETGTVAVWTPCLACQGGELVTTKINDPRGDEPSAILCGPCDERLTEEATRPPAPQDGPSR